MIVLAMIISVGVGVICFVTWLCLCRTPKNAPEAPPVYPQLQDWQRQHGQQTHWQQQQWQQQQWQQQQWQQQQWQQQHWQQQGHGSLQFQHAEPTLNPRAQWQVLDRRPQTESLEITQFGIENEFQQRARELASPEVRRALCNLMDNHGRLRLPSAGSDHPPFFLSLESVTSLPANGKRHHIFTGGLTPDSIILGAVSMSKKRAQHIFENTVFCPPKNWNAWTTRRGRRIVSSERVITVQCQRRRGRGDFFVSRVEMRYAIFRNDGHCVYRESLRS